jgi:hypothetical protein
MYVGGLQSSWTHLITQSQNFVEVRWRSLYRSTSLGNRCISYNAPPTSRKLSYGRFKEPLLGWRNNLSGESAMRDWKAAMDVLTEISGTPLEHPPYSPDLAPCDFLGFSNHEKRAPRSKPLVSLSSWSLRQTVCSTFSRSGWSVVRNASLAKGGTSIKRPSRHLHKVPNRSNKVSPRTLQTDLVFRFATLLKMLQRTWRWCQEVCRERWILKTKFQFITWIIIMDSGMNCRDKREGPENAAPAGFEHEKFHTPRLGMEPWYSPIAHE